MRATGARIRLRVSEYICITMELFTKAIGNRICSMVRALRNGQMGAATRDSIRQE